MAQYKISKKRLAEIIREEYESIMGEESKKPDFLDLDKDGDKKEPMEDAAEDKEEKGGEKKGKKNIFSGRILEIEGLPNLKVEQAFELSDASAERSAGGCTIRLNKKPIIE